MKFFKTKLDGVFVIEPKVYKDSRGFFLESYHEESFKKNGIQDHFVQDNHSRSCRGVLRGLHCQVGAEAQAKLVRVLSGEIFDVAVDMRTKSPTFGEWVGETLSSENHKMMYIPEGFMHGFCVLKDADVFYKTSRSYSPQHERGILWKDSKLAIQWPKLDIPYILSERDQKNPSFEQTMKQGSLR